MRTRCSCRWYWAGLLSLGLGELFAPGSQAQPPNSSAPPPAAHSETAPKPKQVPPLPGAESTDPFRDLLGPEMSPIDLPSALSLAGIRNPQILLARQRVVEAVALRQLAAAQILPTLNYGASFDDHNGNLQQSSGNILKVDRSAIYLGAGAKAIAAGTVSIPGVVWNLNPAQAIYGFLASRQVVAATEFASRAMENEMLREVALGYTALLQAEGRRSLARQIYEDSREVERATEEYTKFGVGRKSDADRARTERWNLEAELREAQGEVLTASAHLSHLLNLDPSVRLQAEESVVLPMAIVPDPIPLCELVAIALLQRPEMNERRALVREALMNLNGAKALPFSPYIFVGISGGNEGGGSNLVHQIPGTDPFSEGRSRFGNFAARSDIDVIAFWALQNFGVGNVAMIREARSRMGISDFRLMEMMDRVRFQVARSYLASHARFAQIRTAEDAVREATTAYKEDLTRIRGGIGRPIELLNSLRLLQRARYGYLNAIIAYNQAQIDLYVALGQPPADMLARPVPQNFLPPPEKSEEKKAER